MNAYKYVGKKENEQMIAFFINSIFANFKKSHDTRAHEHYNFSILATSTDGLGPKKSQ